MTNQPNETAAGTPHTENVQTELQQVPASAIEQRLEDFAFRDEEELSQESLDPLAEDLKLRGIVVPLLLAALGAGRYLLLDGHRRFHAVKLNIERGIAGFTADYLVPAIVIVSDVSELAMLSNIVSANVQRVAFSVMGRLRAVTRLHRLGMPKAQIARCCGVSEATIDRDLILGSDDEIMQRVRDHEITASSASTLVKAAVAAGRLPEFKDALRNWVERVRAQIDQEEMARAEHDETSLSLVEQWPQRHMSPELVRWWIEALEKKKPLSEPSFRFKALLRDDRGRQRLEINGLSKDVYDMSAQDLGKVYVRLTDLAAALEPTLKAKATAPVTQTDAAVGADEGPGRKRLRDLGLLHLVETDDDDEKDGGPSRADAEPRAEASSDDASGDA